MKNLKTRIGLSLLTTAILSACSSGGSDNGSGGG